MMALHYCKTTLANELFLLPPERRGVAYRQAACTCIYRARSNAGTEKNLLAR
jgi:hypothetical protein